MRNHNFPFNSFSILELKSQLEAKLRFPISGKPDCAKLSDILVVEGYGSISETTLYRLFINYNGLIPYRHTLTVLVQYIGYSSWESYFEIINNEHEFNFKIINKQNNTNGLLYHCMEQEANKPLLAYFESLSEKEYEYQFKMGLDVFDSLQQVKNPKRFFTTFIKNDFVKNYVLEYLYDPASRIKDYSYAYELYPNSLKPSYNEAQLQDFVFSKSVLFRYYFLSGQMDKAISIGKKLYNQKVFDKKDLELLFIYPKMRYRAYKIWYLILSEKSKTDIEEYVLKLLEYAKKVYTSIDPQHIKMVFHCIAETMYFSAIDNKYFLLLKDIFKEEYNLLPEKIFDKSLKNTLPYFEPNGLLYYRPLQ